MGCQGSQRNSIWSNPYTSDRKFTPEEEKAWVDELIGQAADGFGEGFEQREIKIDDGYICVSFWNGSDDYFMENQDDFENRMSDDQNMGMQMGGM